MKIYVISARRCMMLLLLFAAVILVFGVALLGGSKVITTINNSLERELPVYYVESQDKKAAITFDCAWGADDIQDILNTLKKEKVKATFFMVGQWAEKFPDAVKLMVQEGHDIANHSYSHLRMDTISAEKIRTELSKCESVLETLAGKKVELFRPPYGSYNNSVIRTARELGYYTIQWDVDSLDWRPGISKDEILSRVTKKIKPGSIILFHNDTTYTAKLLPTLISSLKKDGYELLPVSELILRENYEMANDGQQKKKQ